jgi:hypothetical protein
MISDKRIELLSDSYKLSKELMRRIKFHTTCPECGGKESSSGNNMHGYPAHGLICDGCQCTVDVVAVDFGALR